MSTTSPAPDDPAATSQVLDAPGRGRVTPSRGRYQKPLPGRYLRLLIGAFLVDQIGSWAYFS